MSKRLPCRSAIRSNRVGIRYAVTLIESTAKRASNNALTLPSDRVSKRRPRRLCPIPVTDKILRPSIPISVVTAPSKPGLFC